MHRQNDGQGPQSGSKAGIGSLPEGQDPVARENAYLRLRNQQLQDEITSLSADNERMRQIVERLHGRTPVQPSRPQGGGQ